MGERQNAKYGMWVVLLGCRITGPGDDVRECVLAFTTKERCDNFLESYGRPYPEVRLVEDGNEFVDLLDGVCSAGGQTHVAVDMEGNRVQCLPIPEFVAAFRAARDRLNGRPDDAGG